MLALYLAGCLINHDLYEQRRAELTDADADGHAQAEDCDDTDAAVFPGATEVCNGVDDDCDQLTDEDAVDASPWYRDADLDGYGNPADLVLACQQPQGYTQDDTDCDDLHDQVHPGADEVPYDDLDNDCQGGDLTDVDGDTHAATQVGGDDCDDLDAEVYPGAAETWGNYGTDNDCDDEALGLASWSADQADWAWQGDIAGGEAGRRMETTPDGRCLVHAASFTDDYTGRLWMEGPDDPALRSTGTAGAILGPRPSAYFGGDIAFSQDGVLLTSTVTAQGGAGEVWAFPESTTCSGAVASATDIQTAILSGASANSYFGSEIEWLGDLDGDGIGELAVSATHQLDMEGTEAGAIYIWFSPSLKGLTAVASDADLTINGSAGRHLRQFASASSAALGGEHVLLVAQDGDGAGGPAVFKIEPGDLRSDEAAALATGSIGTWESGATALGVSPGWDVEGDRVLVGGSTRHVWHVDQVLGTLTTTDSELQFEGAADAPISFVSPLGDVDGDGEGDLLLQSVAWPDPVEIGQVHLVLGADIPYTGSVTPASATFHATGGSPGDRFGYRAVRLNDLDDDGRDEIAMSATGQSSGGTDAGMIYVLGLPW